MSVTAIYAFASTTMFVLLSVMLSGNHTLTSILRALCIILALFGFVVGLANCGFVLANGVRLI